MMSYKENNKILYVDDEEELLKSFKSLMRKEKCTVVTLSNSAKIENILEENGPFAVVLSDQRMPNYDGVKVLELCKAKSAETIRVLVTGYADQKDTIRAVNIGGINHIFQNPGKMKI